RVSYASPTDYSRPLIVRWGRFSGLQALEGHRRDRLGDGVGVDGIARSVPLGDRVDHAEEQARDQAGSEVRTQTALGDGGLDESADLRIYIAAGLEGFSFQRRVSAHPQQQGHRMVVLDE